MGLTVDEEQVLDLTCIALLASSGDNALTGCSNSCLLGASSILMGQRRNLPVSHASRL